MDEFRYKIRKNYYFKMIEEQRNIIQLLDVYFDDFA